MKMSSMRWLVPVVLVAVPLAIACGSDESEDGSGGGSSGPKLDTGSACKVSSECYGGLCLTDSTFADLTENDAEAEIPNGYCSLLACDKNQAEGKCGPGAYCFDLEQFVDTPLTACFHECQDDTDCRQSEDYVCTDVSGTQWTPLPRKACLPPSLLCLLEVPQPSCPDVGAGGAAGSAGASGSAGSAGSAGAAGSGG